MKTSQQPRPHGLIGAVREFAKGGFGISAAIGGLFWYWSGDWIILPAIVLVWVFWRTLPADDAPPGLQFAFSFHLFQIVAGVLYTALTGRLLYPHTLPQYQWMMVLAVGSVFVMFLGFLAGDRWFASWRKPVERVDLDISLKQLFLAYAGAVVVRPFLIDLGMGNTVFGQAIVAIAAAQVGLLYLVLRRLFLQHRYGLIVPLLLFETALGFSGFYASFKEPIILALIASMEVFQPKKVGHWALVAVLVGSVLGMSVMWLGIRNNIRTNFLASGQQRTVLERFQFAVDEGRVWWNTPGEDKYYDADALADRVWDIYYTALALDRVPKVIPHQDGAILRAALQHVLAPRFIFPNKPELPSESADVIKYAGVKVAGREEGTTIAFGYVIQSYIDFGVPLMFVPPLLFGILVGTAYRWFMTTIHHKEILIGVLAMAFWANIMPYNVTWAKMLGKLITSFVYVGGLAVIFDHMLYISRRRAEAPGSLPRPAAGSH